MATNTVLSVILQAKDQMSGALRTAGSGLKTFHGQITALSTSFLAFRQIGGDVTRVFADVMRGIKDVVDEGQRLHQFATRLGASAQALDELRYVAEQSDVQFNQLALGLQRMTRRVAEAAKGTGEAKGALKELGLDAEVLNRLPLDKKFETIADRIHGVGNEADRVRLLFKLFDSEGVAIGNTMTKGAEGIRAARDAMRELGGWTDETAEAMADAARQMKKLEQAAGEIRRRFVTEFLKNITEDDIDRIARMAAEIAKLAAAVGSLGTGSRVQGGLAAVDEMGAYELERLGLGGAYANPAEVARRQQAELAKASAAARVEYEAKLAEFLAAAGGGPLAIERVRGAGGGERFITRDKKGDIIEVFEAMEKAAPEMKPLAYRLKEISVDIPRDAETALGRQIELTRKLHEEFGANVVDAAFQAVDSWSHFAAEAIMTGQNVWRTLADASKMFLRSVLQMMLEQAGRDFGSWIVGTVLKLGVGAATGGVGGVVVAGASSGMDFDTSGTTWQSSYAPRVPLAGVAPARLAAGGGIRGGGRSAAVLNITVNAGFGSRAEGEAAARTIVAYARSAGVV